MCVCQKLEDLVAFSQKQKLIDLFGRLGYNLVEKKKGITEWNRMERCILCLWTRLDHIIIIDLLEDPRLVDSVADNDQNGNDYGKCADHHRYAVVLRETDVEWRCHSRTKADLIATWNCENKSEQSEGLIDHNVR